MVISMPNNFNYFNKYGVLLIIYLIDKIDYKFLIKIYDKVKTIVLSNIFSLKSVSDYFYFDEYWFLSSFNFDFQGLSESETNMIL